MNQDPGHNWGGRRTGAGRKPWKKKRGVLKMPAVDGGKTAWSIEPDMRLAEPPDDLPEAQGGLWRAWAPLALERRTLTAETVPAFVLLCELEAQKRAISAELDGKPTPGDRRLFALYSKQVEGLMGRFCLAPFGKPVVSEKPKVAVNPFAQVAG